MTKHTPIYRDTNWNAVEMGSEGWAVFAGPKMIASHLTKEQARLIAAAPKLLEALRQISTILEGSKAQMENQIRFARTTAEQAIRKATEEQMK